MRACEEEGTAVIPCAPSAGLVCFVYWVAADLPHHLQTADHLLELARERNLAESLDWAHYFRAARTISGTTWKPPRAISRQSCRAHTATHGIVFPHSTFGLASTHQAQGLVKPARDDAASGGQIRTGDEQSCYARRRQGVRGAPGAVAGAGRRGGPLGGAGRPEHPNGAYASFLRPRLHAGRNPAGAGDAGQPGGSRRACWPGCTRSCKPLTTPAS